MSTPQTRTIYQNLVDSDAPPIKLYTLLESLLTEELIQELLSSAPSSPLPIPIRIGISPAYNSAGTLCAIALASETVALIIQFNNEANAQREMLSSQVFCNADCFLYAFDLGPLAAALYLDRKLRMLNGIDVQDACLPGEGSDRDPFAAIKFAVGEGEQLYKENIDSAFEDLTWDTSLSRCFNSVALRAWVARYLPNIADMEERFNGVKRVNTQDMDDEYVKLIAQFARGDQRLAAKKPNTTAHDFKTSFTNKQKAKLTADRFQDRFRKNSDMQLRVRDATGAEYLTHGGTAVVAGRSATIETADRLEGKTILGVTTLNAAKPTIVDRQKAYHSLRAFQGHAHLLTNPFLKYILQPSQEFSWPEEFISTETIPPVLSDRLNDSQLQAVKHMLSLTDTTRITMIQGPPGTGKTTVIAAFVQSAVAAGYSGIWLVAQTNVAVKNIAEKLADVGFLNWKVLVSADFHFEWHEHMYLKINKNVIQSSQFKQAARLLQDCSVVLCTLSMLSNVQVQKLTFKVPIKILVVDEASQIAVNDYVPPLQNFDTIQKICFIGDDQQLPPYGQDEIEDLRSVFEVEHLHAAAILLDIQYRMPPHIGDFISSAVYEGRLASNPLHPVQEPLSYFFDIDPSGEKRFGTSWMNEEEGNAVVEIAARLEEEKKSYRIITPYDAQRNYLENRMKSEGLRWQDKCFNVDSFQGNEDDYIIISLVRSKATGFLDDRRRTNVMLTRCKRAMYICTTWAFIWDAAQDTLVGEMAAARDEDAWRNLDDIENGDY